MRNRRNNNNDLKSEIALTTEHNSAKPQQGTYLINPTKKKTVIAKTALKLVTTGKTFLVLRYTTFHISTIRNLHNLYLDKWTGAL